MIAIDTKILVYAHRSDSIFHADAAAAVRRAAEGSDLWAIPWPCIHEFLAVATNPRIYKPPTRTEKAVAQVELWMASPTLRLIGESGAYWPDDQGNGFGRQDCGCRFMMPGFRQSASRMESERCGLLIATSAVWMGAE